MEVEQNFNEYPSEHVKLQFGDCFIISNRGGSSKVVPARSITSYSLMVSTLARKAGIARKAGKWAFFQNLAGKAVKPYGFLLLWLEKLEF